MGRIGIGNGNEYGLRSVPAPALLGPALQLPGAGLRLQAALDLCVLGPGAAPAIPDLVAALEGESSPEVRGAVLDALSAIGPQIIPALLDLSRTKDCRVFPIVVRLCFLHQCESLPGNLWSPALPELRKIVRTGDPFVKDWASRLSDVLERAASR